MNMFYYADVNVNDYFILPFWTWLWGKNITVYGIYKNATTDKYG